MTVGSLRKPFRTYISFSVNSPIFQLNQSFLKGKWNLDSVSILWNDQFRSLMDKFNKEEGSMGGDGPSSATGTDTGHSESPPGTNQQRYMRFRPRDKQPHHLHQEQLISQAPFPPMNQSGAYIVKYIGHMHYEAYSTSALCDEASANHTGRSPRISLLDSWLSSWKGLCYPCAPLGSSLGSYIQTQ
jgi:hypothetical protein